MSNPAMPSHAHNISNFDAGTVYGLFGNPYPFADTLRVACGLWYRVKRWVMDFSRVSYTAGDNTISRAEFDAQQNDEFELFSPVNEKYLVCPDECAGLNSSFANGSGDGFASLAIEDAVRRPALQGSPVTRLAVDDTVTFWPRFTATFQFYEDTIGTLRQGPLDVESGCRLILHDADGDTRVIPLWERDVGVVAGRFSGDLIVRPIQWWPHGNVYDPTTGKRTT